MTLSSACHENDDSECLVVEFQLFMRATYLLSRGIWFFSENRIFRKSLYGSAEMCVIPRKRCSISWESHFSPKRCIVPRKRCIILWNHCLISQESYFLQKLCMVPPKMLCHSAKILFDLTRITFFAKTLYGPTKPLYDSRAASSRLVFATWASWFFTLIWTCNFF